MKRNLHAQKESRIYIKRKDNGVYVRANAWLERDLYMCQRDLHTCRRDQQKCKRDQQICKRDLEQARFGNIVYTRANA